MIERYWNADWLATIIGVIFLAVGLFGFVQNPVVSESGFFQVNDAHNWVHIATGVIFLAGVLFRIPVLTLRALAVIYALIAIIGLAIPDRMLFGVIEMNAADRWLHLAVAAVLLLVGFLTPARENIRTAHF
ncbi:MAG TPA: DUF4383 domain-containing protein [Methylocystis sp.]|nr:DUF4383 domain-containing protein [Methylocystis sp.]